MSNLIKLLQNIFIFCIIFLFIFAPRLSIGGGINLAFVSLLIVLFLFVIERRRLIVNKQFFMLGSFLLALANYHSILGVIYGNDVTFFATILVSIFLYVVFGWALSFILVKRGVNLSSLLDQLILLCAIAVFLNSAVIIIEYLFPAFRAVVESYLITNEAVNYAEGGVVYRGFSAAGGAGLSVANAVGILLFIYLALNARVSNSLALFCSLVNVLASIFVGRTGLIAGLIFVSIFVLMLLFKNLRSGISGIGRAVVLVVAVLFVLQFLNSFDLDPETAYWAFEWANGLDSGWPDTGSTNELKAMLFLPDNPIHLLFGFGFYEGVNSLYPRSDSGYLKTLFSIGLIPGAILYFVIAALFYKLCKVSNNYRWLVVSILLFMFAVEVKEPFLYQNFTARVIFLLSGAAMFVLAKRRALAEVIRMNANHVE